MNDSKKSGYELRSELLNMAIRILQDGRARQHDNEYLKPEGQRHAVDPYAAEDVLSVADKLYEFVQKK